MKITYEWREITADGLLKEPRDIGPYYDETSLRGGDTKEEAMENLEHFFSMGESFQFNDYVLVEVYSY